MEQMIVPSRFMKNVLPQKANVGPIRAAERGVQGAAETSVGGWASWTCLPRRGSSKVSCSGSEG